MTIAATQLRTEIEARWPGVRISRLSCRLTAAGGISQHSAYDGYDSNALDVMGGPIGWTRAQNIALIQEIVDWLADDWSVWSVRKVLWQVPDHYGHAHIDFYPMMVWPLKWCGGPETPIWKYSRGGTITSRDPEPENGRYNGEDDMTYEQLRVAEFDLWSDQNIRDAYDRGRFEDAGGIEAFAAYWCWTYTGDDGEQLNGGRGDRTPAEKARFMTDYYARL